ncbi:DUF6316 family protein [Pleionea sediminis]|uniref:DUF6316 family protein n=1 Tax=Pleionea sediminis TaxID=2569479 RepID=UPI001185D918|nr:DUF6316 family protein [Pleionea sediminis]
MRKTDILEQEFSCSSRYVQRGNSWYFKTREGDLLGPYATPEEASEAVELYIALMELHGADDKFAA